MKEDIDILFKNWRNIPIVSTQLFMQDFPYLTSPWEHWNKVVDVLKNSQDPSIHVDENTENDENAENVDNVDNVDEPPPQGAEQNNSNLKDESFEVKIETREESENTDENIQSDNVDWVQSDDEL